MRSYGESARPALVTVHLWRVPGGRVPVALARMALDRRPVRQASGLLFGKLLGTGHGHTFTPGDANPRRWGLLASWDSAAAAAAFEDSATARRWRRLAEETWRAELRPLTTHGRWSGHEPFGRTTTRAGAGVAPVVVVTRARVAVRRAVRFWRAAPAVSRELHGRVGLRLAIGIGEAPLGVTGTFSVWESAAAVQQFAYAGSPAGSGAHLDAIRRTGAEGWYVEELFARFAVLTAAGTVDGRDPLR
jgi:hypothetical protein